MEPDMPTHFRGISAKPMVRSIALLSVATALLGAVRHAPLAGAAVEHAQSAAPPAADADARKLAERERKVKVARDRFAESVEQVRVAHSQLAPTTRASVIYEVLKEQAGSGRCREELAKAKTDSARARGDLGKAVRMALQKFEQAVGAAGSIDSEFFKKGIGRSADEEFPWYPTEVRNGIREKLRKLGKIYDYVNSSMTKGDHRARLWTAAKDYEALGASHGLPKGEAAALIPSAIDVPCVGKRIEMHAPGTR